MRRLFILSILATMIAIGGCGGGGGQEGTSADPLGTDSITLESTASQVDSNNTVVLTATVKNVSGALVAGREVEFGFVANASGAILYSASAKTNSSGVASVLYKAGAVAGTDVVRASLSNKASQDVGITVGAGGGGGVAGYRIVLSGSAASMTAGQNSILTATVTDSSGNPVNAQVVAFSFITNASGAVPLSVLNGGLTDASGRAVAVYTAGAGSPGSEVQDTVKAEIVGVSTSAIILTRTSTTAPVSTMTLSLSAGITTLTAGQSSILMAKVADQTGKPVNGQVVTFRFLGGVAAPSGGTLTVLNGGSTDASGQALAVYTAGSLTPTAGVQDIVEANITGASGVVIITRTASTAIPPVGYRVTLSAGPSSLAAGQNSILTAKVTDAIGNEVSGQVVTFRFLGGGAAPSGGSLSVLNSGNTDASGQAVAIYTAGNNTPTSAIQDVVEANIAGSSAAVIITRTASATVPPVGYRLVISAGTASLAAGQSSILTARLTDQTGSAVSGQVVAFRFVGGGAAPSGGSISGPLNGGVTDASGQVVAIYTAGSLTPTVAVQDFIEAYIVGVASDAVIVTRTASTAVPPAGYRLAIAADVTSLAASQNAVVTVTVTDGAGTPAGGQSVTFALFSDNSGAALNTLNGTPTNTTDASGRVAAIYTAGANSPILSVQDTVQATITGSAGAIVMTRTAAAAPAPTGLRMTVTATPTSLVAGAMSVIVANVSNADGTPASGEPVMFAIETNNTGAPALTTLNGGLTDTNGRALAIYTAGNNTPGLLIQDAVSASVTGSAGAEIITRLPALGTGNRISLTVDSDGSPAFDETLPTTSSNCVVQANVVRDDGVTPVADETVTFSIWVYTGGTSPTWSSPTVVTTNNSGEANAIFTGPGGPTGFQAVVRAQILGTTNGGDAVGIIYW